MDEIKRMQYLAGLKEDKTYPDGTTDADWDDEITPGPEWYIYNPSNVIITIEFYTDWELFDDNDEYVKSIQRIGVYKDSLQSIEEFSDLEAPMIHMNMDKAEMIKTISNYIKSCMNDGLSYYAFWEYNDFAEYDESDIPEGMYAQYAEENYDTDWFVVDVKIED